MGLKMQFTAKERRFSLPFLLALIGPGMLGTAPIFVRLTDIGPISTAFYRVSLSLPLFWVWLKMEERVSPEIILSLSWKDHALFALAGILFGLDLIVWHWSLGLTTIANAALLNNFPPFFVPLILWLLYAKRPSLRFVFTIMLALLGAILLASRNFETHSGALMGDFLALCAAFGYSCYLIVLKQIRGYVAPAKLMFWTCLFNAFFLAVCIFLSHENFIPRTLGDWEGILGLALIIHVGGQGLLAYSMGYLSAGFVSITLLIAPVTASLLGWLIYDELLDVWQTTGMLLVLVSIMLARQDESYETPKQYEKKKYAT